MASRREQKEALRREREAREAKEREAAQRKKLVGYGVGGFAAVAVVIMAVVLLVGLGGGGSDDGDKASASSTVLPDGGSAPDRKIRDLDAAAKKAGCTMKDFKGKSREHTGDLKEKITYDSNPPTEGKHYQTPANDGAYDAPPDIKELVHALEHGRIIIWFKKNLPSEQRANLKALFEEDSYQMLLTPDPSGMKYQVAASAWSRDPTPNGTGHLLACTRMDDGVFDAIRAFKDEWRGNGPEAIP